MPTPPASDNQQLYSEMRRHARDIFDYALRTCSIPAAMKRHVQREGQHLRVDGEAYALRSFSRVHVISVGKAGHTQAESLSDIAGGGLSGIISCPTNPEKRLPDFRYFVGGHPLPNEGSLRAADAILDLLGNTGPHALNLFLISGGASAIAEKPISPNISLADVIATYNVLVHSGAPISEINAVRKHLSAVKGGRMAAMSAGSQQLSLLVSDVPDNALDALASGPTMPDSTTVEQCYAIADKYGMVPLFPHSVRELFERRRLQETPKADDPAFRNSRYLTILSNATAVHAAAQSAALNGFVTEVDNDCDDGDYAEAADHLLAHLHRLREAAPRVSVISGGEVTVKTSNNPGTGGRNQQFALYCAEKIAGQSITVLSAGTDGIDGNSRAAGAIADGTSVARARAKGMDTQSALSRFDAFPLFDALGDAIITGPSGSNVRDLRVLLAY
jgi:hydroxypyruvate reductase